MDEINAKRDHLRRKAELSKGKVEKNKWLYSRKLFWKLKGNILLILFLTSIIKSINLGDRTCPCAVEKSRGYSYFEEKNKDPKQLSSYRPISLTSILGKTMEKLILNRLNCYLPDINLILKEQAGFRKIVPQQTRLLTSAKL
ncbi:hypothetical protein CEXT_286741 [Caerostris extrusa]|uniref:Reverse transcriptase domain-containing protein n=1 Tax=Caerostris extrusa TaxID=172846 RepID=A0AAV4XY67_CAEEX|nr:hypothetical protein CEXT_286741 [Caerostris extrusa]